MHSNPFASSLKLFHPKTGVVWGWSGQCLYLSTQFTETGGSKVRGQPRQQSNETGILDPRPKLLGFCLQVWHGEGRRKEIDYMALDMLGKMQSEHSAHLQPSSGTDVLQVKWTRTGGRGRKVRYT
jgi:hypothetical protein